MENYANEAISRVSNVGLFFSVIAIIAAIISPGIISFLANSLQLPNTQIVSTNPFDAFNIPLNFALSLSALITLPLFLWQAFKFISPALTNYEKTQVKNAFFPSLILYFMGAMFGFAAYLWLIQTTISYSLFPMLLSANELITSAFFNAAVFAIIFQLPIIIILATKMGLVSTESLEAQKIKFSFAALIGSAVITPTGDPITFILLAGPIILLFFVGIKASKKKEVM